MCMNVFHVCMLCTTCMPGASGGQKSTLVALILNWTISWVLGIRRYGPLNRRSSPFCRFLKVKACQLRTLFYTAQQVLQGHNCSIFGFGNVPPPCWKHTFEDFPPFAQLALGNPAVKSQRFNPQQRSLVAESLWAAPTCPGRVLPKALVGND